VNDCYDILIIGRLSTFINPLVSTLRCLSDVRRASATSLFLNASFNDFLCFKQTCVLRGMSQNFCVFLINGA